MSIRCRQWGLAVVFAFLAGCGSKAPEITEPVDNTPKGPDYEVFAPMAEASMEATLPKIVGEGVEQQCFKPVEGLAYGPADLVVKDHVSKYMGDIKAAFAKWVVGKLAPLDISEVEINKWDITFEDLVSMEVGVDQVGFIEDPGCLDKKGWVPEGQHLMSAVYGAKTIKFESKVPLVQADQTALLEAVGMQNIVMESQALFAYDPVVSEAGEPLLDPEGNPLHHSPGGDYIPAKDIPPPEERQMKDWVWKSEAPIYFAFKEFPRSGWRKEGAKEKCNLILIPDALNPQAPDCPEFQESAFSVSILEGEDKPVSITIKTGEELKGVTLGWKESEKIQINDRIILWLMPEKVEVGVNLWLNSLVINPAPMPEGSGGGEDPGWEDVPVSKEKEAAVEEEKAEKAEKEEKAKKKGKKKKSDEASIDAYLND